jgi:anaerobic dimethyl sulfoxide reductase subunit B (iron-sulfur subunit)
MQVCPHQAISKSEEGIVTVNRAKCKRALACLSACPFSTPKFADDKQEPNALIGWQVQHPMQKCTMCINRLDKGDKPTCVKACVARALDFGSLDTLFNRYPTAVQLNETDFPYAYKLKGGANTKPSFLVKRKISAALGIHKARSSVYRGS